MDDGPRIGGLQALLVLVGLGAGYGAVASTAYGTLTEFLIPAIIALTCLAGVIWLEFYARRRAREDREERERRWLEAGFAASGREERRDDAGR
jgi:hypothetical protein